MTVHCKTEGGRSKGGRPTLYEPAHCAAIVALGRKGLSVAEMAHRLAVSKQTLHNWRDTHPEFLDAFARARQASQAWWEQAGRDSLFNPNFNGALWVWLMSVRFPEDWGKVTRRKISGPDGKPIEIRSAAGSLIDELDDGAGEVAG